MAYALTMSANLSTYDDTSEHKLGNTVLADDDTVWIYGQAAEDIATGGCTIDTSTYQITDATGRHSTAFAIPSGKYAWVQDITKFTPLATVV